MRPERIAYFLNIAHAVSLGSKDPSTRVGCIITDRDGVIRSSGYNGHPMGADEEVLGWDREHKYIGSPLHAEENAMYFSGRDRIIRGWLFCTHAPCAKCLAAAIQCGIRKIYYSDYGPTTRMRRQELERILHLLRAAPWIQVWSEQRERYGDVVQQLLEPTEYIDG